jgi:Holliday junction resolvase RusA-like endonuclease
MEQAASIQPFTKATELDITFFMKPPQRRKENGGWHQIRPDTSNLLKMYEDVLQDCRVLQDDALIAKIIARKIYDEEPRTIIILTEL